MTFESSRPLLVSFQELVSFLYYWDLLLLPFSLPALFLVVVVVVVVVVASVVEAILSFLVLVKLLPRYFDNEERLEVVAAETRVVAAARSTRSDHHPRET